MLVILLVSLGLYLTDNPILVSFVESIDQVPSAIEYVKVFVGDIFSSDDSERLAVSGYIEAYLDGNCTQECSIIDWGEIRTGYKYLKECTLRITLSTS